MGDLVGQLDPVGRARSVTGRFIERHGIDGYEDLVARSIAEPDWFWDEVVSFLGLPFSRHPRSLAPIERVELR